MGLTDSPFSGPGWDKRYATGFFRSGRYLRAVVGPGGQNKPRGVQPTLCDDGCETSGALPLGRLHKRTEQRMRLERPRLKLRMIDHGRVKRMILLLKRFGVTRFHADPHQTEALLV